MKRFSISSFRRELCNKETLKNYYIPVRMNKIQKTDNTKCCWGCTTTGTLIHCWWWTPTGTTNLEDILAVSSKTKAMAPHSSTLAWKIPWTEETGRLQSMGSLRVGHDWETLLSLFTFMHWRKMATHYCFLENPRDRGALWTAVYEVAQSRTRLMWFSSLAEDLYG